jgi:hypothetical protein
MRAFSWAAGGIGNDRWYYHSRLDDQGSAFSAMSVAAFGQ